MQVSNWPANWQARPGRGAPDPVRLNLTGHLEVPPFAKTNIPAIPTPASKA
ncbi:MAG TPA: hypothetical protein PKX77_05535 [Verrucomicrobiota bacterium]|nr:hypothetical protein [Verrucomicrobiota bacterium]HPL36018.1 hypothetical protein [Verrucomicrobiota bacterium]